MTPPLPPFTMTAEHLARSLAIARARERARCISRIRQLFQPDGQSATLPAILAALGEEPEPQAAQVETAFVDQFEISNDADDTSGLPPEREIPDEVEALHLARKFGRFG